MVRPARKLTKSAKLDDAKFRQVKRFLRAKTDSEAISKAIDMVYESKLVHEFIDKYGGTLPPDAFEPDEP
jgi:hypothetical protein